jgi:hypothetical protein
LLKALDYSEAELRALLQAARAGGLEQLAQECEQALELKLPMSRLPAIQAVVEAWRANGAQKEPDATDR